MTELTSNKWTEYRRPGGSIADRDRAIAHDQCVMFTVMAPFLAVIGYSFGYGTAIAMMIGG